MGMETAAFEKNGNGEQFHGNERGGNAKFIPTHLWFTLLQPWYPLWKSRISMTIMLHVYICSRHWQTTNWWYH